MTKRNFSESSISTEINSEMVPATSVQLVQSAQCCMNAIICILKKIGHAYIIFTERRLQDSGSSNRQYKISHSVLTDKFANKILHVRYLRLVEYSLLYIGLQPGENAPKCFRLVSVVRNVYNSASSLTLVSSVMCGYKMCKYVQHAHKVLVYQNCTIIHGLWQHHTVGKCTGQ